MAAKIRICQFQDTGGAEEVMLLELSVIPLGRGRSISADVADLVKIIDASGLDYRLTAAGTIIEGTWDQV